MSQIQNPNQHPNKNNQGAAQAAPKSTVAPEVQAPKEPTDEEIAAQLDKEEEVESLKAELLAAKELIEKMKASQPVETLTPKKTGKVEKKAKGIKLTPIEVVATDIGFYGNRRIKPDQKFKLEDESDFSHNWMEKI